MAHLRESLVYTLLYQRVKILQTEAGGAQEAAVLPAGRLQTRHPAPDVRRVDAQQDAEGYGHYGAEGRGDAQRRRALPPPPLLGRRLHLLHAALGGSSGFRALHLTSRVVWSQVHQALQVANRWHAVSSSDYETFALSLLSLSGWMNE